MRLPDDIKHFDAGRVVGIVGMPGAGKTKDLLQVICRSERAVLAVDTVGALADELSGIDPKTGEQVGPPLDVLVVPIKRGVDIDTLWQWTAKQLSEGRRVCWDLREWDPVEMQALIDALMPRIKTMRNAIFIVDEIQRLAPDFSADLGRGVPALKDWFTKRRNYGVTVVWTSQRPAFVSMTVRGITDRWLIHRLFYPNDIEVIRKLMGDQPGVDVDAMIARLRDSPPGQVIDVDMPFMA